MLQGEQQKRENGNENGMSFSLEEIRATYDEEMNRLIEKTTSAHEFLTAVFTMHDGRAKRLFQIHNTINERLHRDLHQECQKEYQEAATVVESVIKLLDILSIKIDRFSLTPEMKKYLVERMDGIAKTYLTINAVRGDNEEERRFRAVQASALKNVAIESLAVFLNNAYRNQLDETKG